MHAITAQPFAAGDAGLRAALAERGCDVPALPLHSDPGHALCCAGLLPSGTLITRPAKAAYEVANGPHELIQPALVVLDRAGGVVRTWNWRDVAVAAKPAAGAGAEAGAQDASEMTTVSSQLGRAGSVPFEKDTALVTVRPAAADLLAALAEQRPVGLESVMYFN